MTGRTQEQEQKFTLMRNVRSEIKGWARRHVPVVSNEHGQLEWADGSRLPKGWEKTLDTDPKAWGDDVVTLGEYVVRWYENSRTKYRTLGWTYAEAAAGGDTTRITRGQEIAPAPEGEEKLTVRLDAYLMDRTNRNKITSTKGEEQYRHVLAEFISATGVRYASRVTGAEVSHFLAAMKKRVCPRTKRRLSDRTVLNRFDLLAAFLRWANPALAPLFHRDQKPTAKRKEPVSYSKAEMQKLIDHLYQKPKTYALGLTVEMLWQTGLRSNELACLTWNLVHLDEGFLHVTTDRELLVRPRGKEERVEVFRTKNRRDRKRRSPIPPALLERLREWDAATPHLPGDLIFPTRNGNPDRQLIAKIKTAALRANLHCRACPNCLRPCGKCRWCRCRACPNCRSNRVCLNPRPGAQSCTNTQCRLWTVHRLRHTFITHTIKSNKVDLKTVQELAAHDRLATTERYISASTEAEMQEAVNAVFAA